jgi:hypothetical protein
MPHAMEAITEEGVTLNPIAVEISRGEWELSIENYLGIHTVWDEFFDSLKDALNAGRSAVKVEGVNECRRLRLLVGSAFEALKSGYFQMPVFVRGSRLCSSVKACAARTICSMRSAVVGSIDRSRHRASSRSVMSSMTLQPQVRCPKAQRHFALALW